MFTREFYLSCQEEAEKGKGDISLESVIRMKMLSRSTRLVKATYEEIEKTFIQIMEQDKGIIDSLGEYSTEA